VQQRVRSRQSRPTRPSRGADVDDPARRSLQGTLKVLLRSSPVAAFSVSPWSRIGCEHPPAPLTSFKSARARSLAVCPSCSRLYGTDAWILVATGLNGGKGVPEEVATHPRLFATVTAPSFGAVHTRRTSGTRCHPSRVRECGEHGVPRWCGDVHELDSDCLGAPLCVACFDNRGAVLWNATSSQLWDRTMVRLRRQLAASAGIATTELGGVAQVHYLKVAELQRRGLVHFHALLRADRATGPESDPPTWLTVDRLEMAFRLVVRTSTVNGLDGASRCWGSQVDVSDLSSMPGDDLRIATYLANYADIGITPSTRPRRRMAQSHSHGRSRPVVRSSGSRPHRTFDTWRSPHGGSAARGTSEPSGFESTPTPSAIGASSSQSHVATRRPSRTCEVPASSSEQDGATRTRSRGASPMTVVATTTPTLPAWRSCSSRWSRTCDAKRGRVPKARLTTRRLLA
jgi:hypothetical protein